MAYSGAALAFKIIIEGQKLVERTNSPISVQGQPTKTILTQTCVRVFFIRSVSDTIFVIIFLPKPPRTTWRFKNPVRTSKRTPHFTITEINWLTLFREIKPLFNPLKPKLV
jgi:hypothetical protein